MAGLCLGGLLCALTFMPSLVPRPWLYQAILSGLSFALGYWLGSTMSWLWRFMELPVIRDRWRPAILGILLATLLTHLAYHLWYAADWQNSTRQLMGMPAVEGIYYVRILLIASAVAASLLLLVAGLIWALRTAAAVPRRYIHRRIASVIGVAAFLVLLINVVNGTLVSYAITALDQVQAAVDISDPPGVSPPTRSTRSGSPDSLVGWDGLGQAGKRYVGEGPRAQDIAAFTGQAAMEPIRAYVGLRAADDTETQARLALQELRRMGAFSRELLVIATPTGTGWLENDALAPLEYMFEGDTAIVGVQYSYLPSPFSLILEPGRAQQSASIVFNVIYDYWKSLPVSERPRLYLFGLSLGSLGSETSAPMYAFINPPIQGAIWAGPTFRNPLWSRIQANPHADSPAWQPEFEDGSLIRVIGPQEDGEELHRGWGPVRIVYIVNPSDAISFFDERMWLREPNWMKPPRGPDVSPLFEWVPVISFFEVMMDMLTAGNVPPGHGHNYSAREYTQAWQAVADPADWSTADTDRLVRFMPTSDE
ncbi:hypothetical protein BJB45_12610 [Halomonas huangheensis]|uniref:Alpha/beta-hydrolase catalytic domain-containing protein n=2 Tax=Halomonas huangheensis TaxID=1178482 RepID=W1N911_9GAMM|nr:hypothetical protein AR456_14500 [Halomonas huangheensis]ERL52003.1 hypothetical protein BJB45_12610 [Halomonas huangheensis]